MAYPALLSPALSAALRHIARRRPTLLPLPAAQRSRLGRAGREGHAFSSPAPSRQLARVKGPGDSIAVNGTVLTRSFYTVTLGAGGLHCDCYNFREAMRPACAGSAGVRAHPAAVFAL
jgi:hypothetical protein